MLNELMPLVENSTGENPKILVVEDDQATAELLGDCLKFSLNADLQIAGTARQAMEMDHDNPAEVIIVDYMLPDMDGLELISALCSHFPRPVILMTGHPTLGRAIEAMRLGASDMFVKPFDMEKLTHTISDMVIKYRRSQVRVKRLMRVRELSKKVILERRSLRRKMDLVCRDMVGAYRELAEKVHKIQLNKK
ncbi:MAG: response regulator [Phycisphaerae bacterium]